MMKKITTRQLTLDAVLSAACFVLANFAFDLEHTEYLGNTLEEIAAAKGASSNPAATACATTARRR